MQPPKTKESVLEESEGMGREEKGIRKMKSDRNGLIFPIFRVLSRERERERDFDGYVYKYTLEWQETSASV